jgi:hypothetical protein
MSDGRVEAMLAIRGWIRDLAVAGVALVVAAGVGACGGSDSGKPAPAVSGDQRGILATIDALQTASRRDDARHICQDLFAPSLAKSIRDASKRSCEAEVHRTLTTPDAQLSVQRKISITGSHATATIRERNGNTSAVAFVKLGGQWRISRVARVTQP